VEILVRAAVTFVAKLSSDSAVARASKSLQVEITRKDNKGREEEMNKPFIPDEQLIQDIIRQEIHLAKEEPAGGTRHRKVSFWDNPGRPSQLKQQRQTSRRLIASKSPQNRPKGQKQQWGRSKSPKSSQSSAKNVNGKGSGSVK